MRGFPFVLVPTLSLVNMGVNGASIGNMLAQRGDDAKLGATAHTARQYHTADFSNSDSGAHKGGVAHRALLDTLTQSTVLPSADTGNSTANNGTAVQSVSRRVDVGQNEVTALSEDVQNVASVVPRQVSLDAPSLTNSLAPNTISSGDGLTSVTGVDSLRRATAVADNTEVCSKHKGSVDARALEITKTSAADPIDISNVDTGLALRAQHARQVPPAVTGLPVVGSVIEGVVPRGVDARTLELLGTAGGTELIDSAIDNAARDLGVTPTFNGKPILAKTDLGSGTLPPASDVYTGLVGGGVLPLVGSSAAGGPILGANPISNVGGFGLPVVGGAGGGLPVVASSTSGSPVSGINPISNVGGSGLPAVSFVPVNAASPSAGSVSAVASNVPIVGSSGSSTGSTILPSFGGLLSNIPISGSSTGSNSFPVSGAIGVPAVTTAGGSLPIQGDSANSVESNSNFLGSISSYMFGRQVDTDVVEGDVKTADDVANEITDNTARGLTDMLKSFPALGSRTVKRDASVTLDALKPSLTALFVRQEDTTTASDDSDSGDATSADSTDDGTSSADAVTVSRRQTSDSTEGTVDSADDTNNTSDSTDSEDNSDSVEATASVARRQATDESSTDATGDSTDIADSGDTSDASDATTTTAVRRQTTDDSSETTDSVDAVGDSTDSSGAVDELGSSDASSATRRQSTDDDAAAASDSITEEAADSDSGASDADASASVTRRQTTDDSTDASDSSDASVDSTNSVDSGDVSGSGSMDATADAVTRRQTSDDSTDASDSGDVAADSATDDPADAFGSSDTSGDSSDTNDSISAAVERRQDAADDGSSAQGDASATDGEEASSATSADEDESTSADGSEDVAVRRRALGFKLTPSQLRNRMSMRKGKRQDGAEIADAITDAASGSTDAAAVEESLDNLD